MPYYTGMENTNTKAVVTVIEPGTCVAVANCVGMHVVISRAGRNMYNVRRPSGDVVAMHRTPTSLTPWIENPSTTPRTWANAKRVAVA